MSSSKCTLRIRNIALNLEKAEFDAHLKDLSCQSCSHPGIRKGFRGIRKRIEGIRKARPSNEDNDHVFVTTLALDSRSDKETKVGTIDFGDKRVCKAFLEKIECQHSGVKGIENWKPDDEFHGLTMLSTPADANIDICAIHGIDGHAFNSWQSSKETKSRMWLRDFFNDRPHARIMTFGYDTPMISSRVIAGFDDYAHQLLHSLNMTRRLEDQKRRSLILVCHSMGGLVAIEAMLQLTKSESSTRYANLSLSKFGFITLGSPFAGTPTADFGSLLEAAASGLLGLNMDKIAALKPYSKLTQDKVMEFRRLGPQRPPFVCYHETRTSRAGIFHKTIVPQSSAMLLNEESYGIPNADHVEIAKFQDEFGGFQLVFSTIKDLDKEIQKEQAPARPVGSNVGTALLNAPHFPPPRKYFDVPRHSGTTALIGREVEMRRLREALTSKGRAWVSGTAGVGKTALLSALFSDEKDKRHLFWFRGEDEARPDHRPGIQSRLAVAERVGPDILRDTNPNIHLNNKWGRMTATDKVEAFEKWLADSEDHETSLIVFENADIALEEAPWRARTVFLSARAPDLGVERLKGRRIALPPLALGDTVKLLQEVLHDWDDMSEENIDNIAMLEKVADLICNHPLAARHAVAYAKILFTANPTRPPMEQLIESLNSPDHEQRLDFLDFEPFASEDTGLARSVMSAYRSCVSRLKEPLSREIIRYVSFLDTKSLEYDWREFFHPIEGSDDLHEAILKSGWNGKISSKYWKFRQLSHDILSSGVATPLGPPPAPSRFCELWLECARQDLTRDERKRYGSCIMIISYARHAVAPSMGQHRKHALACSRILKSFDITLDDLDLSEAVRTWISEILESQSLDQRQHETQERVSDLLRECEDASTRLRLQGTDTTDTQRTGMAQKFLLLYKRAKAESSSLQNEAGTLRREIAAVYKVLGTMAPSFHAQLHNLFLPQELLDLQRLFEAPVISASDQAHLGCSSEGDGQAITAVRN